MLYIGIDLSDKYFDSCITNSQGVVLSTRRFDMDESGFISLLTHLHKHNSQDQECLIGLENPRSRLVDFLSNRGYSVMQTQPNAISNYPKSTSPSGAKSDKGDARVISDYLREHHTQLSSIHIPDETIRELSLLLEDRDRLVQQKVRYINQLTSTLKEYFPQALEAFSCLSNKGAIEFLKRIDTFDQLKGLSTKEQEDLLRVCGINQKKSIRKFHKAMKQPGYTVPQSVIKAKSKLKKALVSHLDLVVNQIQEYEKDIKHIMDSDDARKIFRSLPGADYILGGKLLVLYASRDFHDACEAQQLFGTAPYTSMSGQKRYVGFRKGANKMGRSTFQQLARCSTLNSDWAKSQYVKKRKQGKNSQHAYRCLANIWVKITFAMWKSKSTYDENFHLASITRHMMNQPAFT